MDIVRKHLDKLQAIMIRKASTKETFDLGAAISAWARDVSNEFIMGKSYGNLDKEDFDKDFTTMVTDEGRMWRYNKHIPVLRVAFSLPWDFMLWLAGWLGDKGLKNVFTHLKVLFSFRFVISSVLYLGSQRYRHELTPNNPTPTGNPPRHQANHRRPPCQYLLRKTYLNLYL